MLLLGLTMSACPASAQTMYRWVDENGDAHISSRIEDIPERFQKTARPISHPDAAPHESCASPPGDPKGGARVSFSLDQGRMVVNACVNGRGPIRLMVDTGAAPTLISPRVLEHLGAGTNKGKAVPVSGLTGTGTGTLITVRSLQVGGAKRGPIEVIAFEMGGRNYDGILGQNFMKFYLLDVDNQRGVLTLRPR